jgi:hypothetical protein
MQREDDDVESVRVPAEGSKEMACSSATKSLDPLVLPLWAGMGGLWGSVGARRWTYDGGTYPDVSRETWYLHAKGKTDSSNTTSCEM